MSYQRANARFTASMLSLRSYAGPLCVAGIAGLALGCSTSTLTKHSPIITANPNGATVNAGKSVTFTVAAAGSPTLSYQWLKDGKELPGATGSTLTIAAVAASDAGAYSAKVSNGYGNATSTAATLAVNVGPAVTTPLADKAVTEGGDISFAVVATGAAPLSYQWYLGDVALDGATEATYAIKGAKVSDAGSYTVKITNFVASIVAGPAVLTVNPLPVPASIVTAPGDLTVKVGDPAQFTVVAGGTPPFTYQWYKGAAALDGATTDTYTIPAVTSEHAGSYSVLVKNGFGEVTGGPAVLTVRNPITFATNLEATTTAVIPAPASFTVAVNGGVNPTFQWLVNDQEIPDAKSATYVTGPTDFNAFNPSKGTNVYRVIVKDGADTLTSEGSALTVVAPDPTYPGFGDPQPVPTRPITVLPSYHVDAIHFPKGSFRFGYDEALKNPAWTAYANFTFTAAFDNGDRSFRPDDRLVAPTLVTGDMGAHGSLFYLSGGSGYDRGHMVTLSSLSYRYDFAPFSDGQYPSDDTCRMPNVVPQVSFLNQRLWLKLEEAMCGTSSGGGVSTTSPDGRAWVYTGPIFPATPNFFIPRPTGSEFYTTDPTKAPAGVPAIAIPVATYKIAFLAPTPGSGQTLPRVLAWVTSNRPFETAESADIWKYVTSLKRIEELTGLDFTPGLPHDLALAAWKDSVDVRGFGETFEKATGPNLHVIKPSWDLIPLTTTPGQTGEMILVNDAVAFQGYAEPNAKGGSVDLVNDVSWDFGDNTAVVKGLTASHSYTAAKDYTVTFSAKDSLGVTNTITRKVTVSDPAPTNLAPTFTPASLPGISITLPTATATQVFTLADDHTAAGALTLALESDKPSIIDATNASQISAAFDSGTGKWTVTMNPVVAGITAATTVTIKVTATDGESASTAKSFPLVINPAPTGGTAKLIISQYFEGNGGTNKWIEVTNVGTGTYDASATPMHLGLWNNPRTTNKFYTTPIPGTLAPGASILFRNTGTVLPVNSWGSATATTTSNGARIIYDSTTTNGVLNFNGNDPVYITPTAAAAGGVTDAASYTNRTDVIGDYIAPGTDQTMANWDPATTVIIPAGWGTAQAPGANRSYVRVKTVTAPSATYSPAEWVMVDPTELATGTPPSSGLCGTATDNQTNFLGYHAYDGGNL